MSRATQEEQSVVQDLGAAPGLMPFFAAVHAGCLLVLVTGAPADAVAVGIASYLLRGLGISAGYHRYFSHRSFRTSRAFQFVLALLGTLAVQKGVLWWASHHRHHHQASDRDGDVHSPVRDGFWWSHVGWFLSRRHEDTEWPRVRDLARYPELVWLNEHFALPPALFALGLFAAGGLPWLVWGFLLSTTAVWHVTYAINSVAHQLGSRPYDTPDGSRNNLCLAVLALGEGWHNNHHHYMNAARAGFHWWQIDTTYLVLRALAAVGVTWDLVEPPARVLDDRPLSDRAA
jgi:stearoyl-CoA desaturase (delta-9 desaturase)